MKRLGHILIHLFRDNKIAAAKISVRSRKNTAEGPPSLKLRTGERGVGWGEFRRALLVKSGPPKKDLKIPQFRANFTPVNSHLPDNELVDKIASKVVEIFGKNPPVKRLRRSQVLSAFIGAVGFALFVDGVIKLAVDIPGWTAVILGVALMALTGLLLHNLNR